MFNMLITTYRHMETEASAEINALLGEINDNGPEISYTDVSGLLTCRTNLDPLEAIQKIRKLVQDEPWKVRYVLRLIPIDTVVNTDIVDIKNAVKDLASRIKKDETFRVTVEKRRHNIKSMEIIEAVAGVIDRKVSLDKQDWVVLIEVVGRETGISVIKSDDIFSLVKVKRESP
jgi:tRNA acetyltransferase TAN1